MLVSFLTTKTNIITFLCCAYIFLHWLERTFFFFPSCYQLNIHFPFLCCFNYHLDSSNVICSPEKSMYFTELSNSYGYVYFSNIMGKANEWKAKAWSEICMTNDFAFMLLSCSDLISDYMYKKYKIRDFN